MAPQQSVGPFLRQEFPAGVVAGVPRVSSPSLLLPQASEIDERRVQSCVHFMTLKKLNRLAHIRLKKGRDQTHEVPGGAGSEECTWALVGDGGGAAPAGLWVCCEQFLLSQAGGIELRVGWGALILPNSCWMQGSCQ